MDPPYNKQFIEKTLQLIYSSKILDDNGFIIAEQSIKDDEPNVEGLNVFRVKEYKITKMTHITEFC